MKINFRTNAKQFVQKEIKAWGNAITKASVRATTLVARQASTAGKKAVKETYTIKASEMNAAVKVKPASANRPTAVIQTSGKPLSFSKYAAIRQKKSGASIMVRRGRRVVLGGSFKATMPTGHLGVFYRLPNAKRVYRIKDKQPTMLPIVERKGPGAVNLIQSKPARNAIDNYVKQNHGRIYSHELNYYSKSASKR